MRTMQHLVLLALLLAPSALAIRSSLAVTEPQEQSLRVRAPSPTCTMCAFVLDKVKEALNDTAVQASIMAKALEVCDNLPADLSAECASLVQTYEPVIAQFVETADSQQICSLMGACEAAVAAPGPRPQALHLPAGLLVKAARLVQLTAHVQGPASNDACDVCKMTVIEAHSLVTNPTVQGNLLNYTKSLCVLLGDSFTKTCEDYVDVYAPALFDLVEKFLSSDELCVELGICPPAAVAAPSVHHHHIQGPVVDEAELAAVPIA